MRKHLSVLLTAGLVWAGTSPELAWPQAPPQDTGAAAKTTVSPDQKAPSENVKPVAPCGFCLEDGTKIPLALGRELSSAKEATGNRVDFEVTEDILVKNAVVIPKGSVALGTIVEAQAKRRLGRAGKLDVRIEEVRLFDGSRAKLRAVQDTKGQGRQGVMTAAMIGTGILFFPVAPMFLFMHGKDVVIAKGAPVSAYIDGDTLLDASKFSPANPGENEKSANAPAGAATATPAPVTPAPPATPAPQR